MVHQREIEIATQRHGEMWDLTDRVFNIVQESGVTSGLVNIFVVGSTAAVGTIEFEPGLERDLPEMFDRLIPPSRAYGHEQAWHDGNGHSHLQATLQGASLTIPISDRRPLLGTWQQIFLLECDNKPRRRKLIVTIYGE